MVIIPFSATFLNFVSYAAGAVRLSALSHLRVLNVATHDSIGLGEDGPTHHPSRRLLGSELSPTCNSGGRSSLLHMCEFELTDRPADGHEVRDQ